MNFSISLYNGTQIEQIAYNPIVLSSGIINITPSSVTISPQKPTAGGIFSISLVLTDVGTAGASTVTVAPLPTAGFEPYGSNSTFVGDMQADVQTPVTLTLTSLTSLKAGNYVIPVRINYLNNLRQNLSTTVEVPVAIGGSASTFNALSAAARQYGSSRGSASLILMVALAIVAVVFILLFLRERKGYMLLKDEHKRLKEHAKERPTK
jgi:FtsH-binding integral membrane protein